MYDETRYCLNILPPTKAAHQNQPHNKRNGTGMQDRPYRQNKRQFSHERDLLYVDVDDNANTL